MSFEQKPARQNPQQLTGASRVIIRFAELFPNQPKTISTIANLQRNLRDADRAIFGNASVKHGRTDGNMYFDMTLPTHDRKEALTIAIQSTANAIITTMVHLDQIAEAHVLKPFPELDTPYAWTEACKNPGTSVTEAARVILEDYRNALFPSDADLGVDPALEALYI